MIHWRQFPFVRAVIPFIAGIITACYFPVKSMVIVYVLILSLAFAGFFISSKIFRNYRYRWISGTCVSVFLFLQRITSLLIIPLNLMK
ncbi:MAG: hypothetical protein K8S16_10295 [Bacteroidales bacterium]|nr:hypothetical protein [Bacteroidales bacterium]